MVGDVGGHTSPPAEFGVESWHAKFTVGYLIVLFAKAFSL